MIRAKLQRHISTGIMKGFRGLERVLSVANRKYSVDCGLVQSTVSDEGSYQQADERAVKNIRFAQTYQKKLYIIKLRLNKQDQVAEHGPWR